MSHRPTTLCVFCGASNNIPKIFLDAGAEFGGQLAARGIRLVYGGGDCGVMGAIANGSLKTGGQVTGIFPQSLRNIENEHLSLTEILIVDTMHQRKQGMFDRPDAFVVFPGGFGTLDEMFEILTWKQLKLHDKPVIIFNYRGYWDKLVALMNNIIDTGFAKEEVRGFYTVVTELDEIFGVLGV